MSAGVAKADPVAERIRATAPATCGVAIEVPAINVRQSTLLVDEVLG